MAVFADLPVELVDEILKHVTVIYYDEKNDLLAMRMVCKRFAEILKPVGLRTLQMDWTRMDSVERSLRHPLERQTLLRIGHHCEALNIDMMVARDEGMNTCEVFAVWSFSLTYMAPQTNAIL